MHDRLEKDRRTAYLVAAGVILACWGIDVALLGRLPIAALVVRTIWSLSLVVCALLLVGRARWDAGVGWVSSAVSAVGFVVLADVTGGVQSVYFPLVPVLPLLLAQIERESRVAMNIAAGTGFVGSWILIQRDSGSLLLAASWSVFVLFLAWWANFWFLRAREAREAELESLRQKAALEEERARAQAELAIAEKRRGDAERLAAVGRVATGVAHEINNPLAYVQSNLEFLGSQLGAANDSPLREAIEESLTGVERIRQIVDDLRSFGRDPGDRLEEVDANGAANEAARLSSVRWRNVGKLRLDIAPDLPRPRCLRGRLVQVLVNLIVNAADALEQAGRRDGLIELGARAEDGWFRIWVEDDGPGFPEAIADKLFDPFFTTKERGTGVGIGLALCREFAEGRGGTIRATRGALGGARFELRLPIRGTGDLPQADRSERQASAGR